jgi:hypothetical protein
MNRRGFTVVDLVLMTAIGVVLLMNLAMVDDFFDAHSRHECYGNQIAIDKILWNTCQEHEREIFEVAEAYTVKYPEGRPPVLVILFNPNPSLDEDEKEIVVVDLSKQPRSTGHACPQHDDDLTVPTIDYWFAFGRWHCMYNAYHSE